MASANTQDFYVILGVERDASAEQIKSAYRKAALQWHPDRNPNNKDEAEHNFRLAAGAYGGLSDPQKGPFYVRFGGGGRGASRGTRGARAARGGFALRHDADV